MKRTIEVPLADWAGSANADRRMAVLREARAAAQQSGGTVIVVTVDGRRRSEVARVVAPYRGGARVDRWEEK